MRTSKYIKYHIGEITMKLKTFTVKYSVKDTEKFMEINAGGIDAAKELASKKVSAKKGTLISVVQKIDRSNME